MSHAAEVAKEALGQYWDKNLPVNPSAIAYAMNVDIVYDPRLENSGFFAIKDNKPVIFINPRDTMARQRVAIFHELGHYVLGHNEKAYGGGKDYDADEEAADAFAIEMIMPEEAVRLLADKGAKLQELARRFNVGTEAMRLRLEDLGILEG